MTVKSSKQNATIPLLVSFGVTGLYFFLCWFAYRDISVTSLENAKSSTFGPHSGSYLAHAADRQEYSQHDPSNIEYVFRRALLNSPADADVFLAYFDYLQYRNCCVQTATKLIKGLISRSPASMRLYPRAVAFFLESGQKQEAFFYFRKAVQMEPTAVRQLFLVLTNENIDPPELIELTPRTAEGLSLIAAYLARQGPAFKEEWLRTITELDSLVVGPSQNLRTAEQALRFGEVDLAKHYAELAVRFPETESRARRFLNRLTDRKHKR